MKFDLSTALVLGLTLLMLVGLIWIEIHSRRRQRAASHSDAAAAPPEQLASEVPPGVEAAVRRESSSGLPTRSIHLRSRGTRRAC